MVGTSFTIPVTMFFCSNGTASREVLTSRSTPPGAWYERGCKRRENYRRCNTPRKYGHPDQVAPVQRLHRTVYRYRRDLQERFPTPSTTSEGSDYRSCFARQRLYDVEGDEFYLQPPANIRSYVEASRQQLLYVVHRTSRLSSWLKRIVYFRIAIAFESVIKLCNVPFRRKHHA